MGTTESMDLPSSKGPKYPQYPLYLQYLQYPQCPQYPKCPGRRSRKCMRSPLVGEDTPSPSPVTGFLRSGPLLLVFFCRRGVPVTFDEVELNCLMLVKAYK